MMLGCEYNETLYHAQLAQRERCKEIAG